MAKKLTKYQAKISQVKPTADSTEYFKAKKELYGKMAGLQRQFYGMTDETKASIETARQAAKDEARQWKKGKFGYDKDGHSIDLTPKSNRSKPITAMDMLQKMYSTKKGK